MFSRSQFFSQNNSCFIIDVIYLRVMTIHLLYLGIASFDDTIGFKVFIEDRKK